MAVVSKRTCIHAALAATLAVTPFAISGCHSAYVEANITNSTAGPLTLVELDYPSASFGTGTLAAGADYNYRFKVLGSGPTKLIWTDAAHHEHSIAGPPLKEGQEGILSVAITDGSASWTTHLRP